MPNGADMKLGFLAAFVTHPAAPWFGVFACQHHCPEYFSQPQYQSHSNAAWSLLDVWIAGDAAPDFVDFLRKVIGTNSIDRSSDLTVLRTRTGAIAVACPQAFEAAFGVPPPIPRMARTLRALLLGAAFLGRWRSSVFRKSKIGM